MASLNTATSLEMQALDATWPEWRAWLATVAWQLYDSLDPDQPLVTLRKWVFAYTVRVRDTRPLLVLLVGEPPAASPV